jgi:hypothetical protein
MKTKLGTRHYYAGIYNPAVFDLNMCMVLLQKGDLPYCCGFFQFFFRGHEYSPTGA